MLEGLRMAQVRDALIHSEDTAEAEDVNGHQKRIEVQDFAVTEGDEGNRADECCASVPAIGGIR